MGEISEDILEGLRCQECTEFMPDLEAPGYPRTCPACEELAKGASQRQRRRRRRKSGRTS